MAVEAGPERLRLDKWLWHVRLFPSRTCAAEFVREGFARINSMRVVDPSRPVRTGDALTLALKSRTVVIEVVALPERRGSATIAAVAYREIPALKYVPAAGQPQA